jgi:L-threonylcarbamoyladenylate synthase
VIVDGRLEFLQKVIDQHQKEGKKVGVLTTEEAFNQLQAYKVIACGRRANLQTVAAELYDVLRKFDNEEVDIIFSESFPQIGVGEAIMNRLLKAAGNQVIEEY